MNAYTPTGSVTDSPRRIASAALRFGTDWYCAPDTLASAASHAAHVS
jgi:hypothetical protein